MKKLAIVSSYHINCGISQYVEHLEPCLREIPDWHVEIIPIPVSLFRENTKQSQKFAKLEIEKIISKVKDADVVNIQFEPGLYGINPIKISSRIKKIVKNSKKLIITYHSAPFKKKSSFPKSISDLIRYNASSFRNIVFDYLFKQTLKKHNIISIAHTKRERNYLTMMGLQNDKIIDHPLSFVSKKTKDELDYSTEKANLLKSYNLSNDSEIIGFFGFISPYKGIETAIQAMKALPYNYYLLIFGSLHPESLPKDKSYDDYLELLLNIVKKEDIIYGRNGNLAKRVIFCGAPDNDTFVKRMKGCDVIVFPYHEVGQTSSGPAGIALDLSKNILLTKNKCFLELGKYAEGALTYFDIGNHIELSQKIILNAKINKEVALSKYNHRYNIENVALDYRHAFDILTERDAG